MVAYNSFLAHLVRYKSLYYVVFISFLILKIVVRWVESDKIPASKMADIKQSPVPPPPVVGKSRPST